MSKPTSILLTLGVLFGFAFGSQLADAAYPILKKISGVQNGSGLLKIPAATPSPNRAAYFDGTSTIGASTVTATELGYLAGVTSGIQTQINAKEPTIPAASPSPTSYFWRGDKTWAAVPHPNPSSTASRAAYFDGTGQLGASTVTSTELGYLSGVTSGIQAQIAARVLSSWFGFASVEGSDWTTSSNVIGDVTGMGISVAASEQWIIRAFLFIGCDGAGGIKIAFSFPTGSTFRSNSFGVNTGSTTFREDLITASSTLSGVYTAIAGSTGSFVQVMGKLTVGANAGTFQLRAASATDTQTSSIYKQSFIDARRVQ